MKKITLFLSLLLTIEFIFSQTSLVVSGDVWKYHNGSDPGSTWKNVGFNDASWSSGPSQLGYGDGDEATVIPTNYPTSYFRRVINVSNPSIYTGGYTLNVKRDDGVVVYINGTEVYRNTMPAGTPTYNTWASGTCADDGNTWLTSTLPAGTLIAGNNTIAVEVHQVNSGSSDVTFDLTLNGLIPGLPNLTRGPYLQMGTSNGIIIRWRTDVASNTEVRYGTSPTNLNMNVTNSSSVTEHEVTLTGLTPNTKYYYSIGTIGTSIQGDTTNHFYTHPTIGTEYELDVWVTGDCGTGYATQTSVMNQFLNHVGNKYIDAWLLVGDNAYNDGYDSEYQSGFFGPYQNSRLMKQTVIWPTPGNHDYYSAPNLGDRNFDYYKNFNMPTAGQLGGVPSGTEAFFSYNIGNVHFVSLDSYGTEAGLKMYDTTGAQAIWLKNDLAANTQKWTVLYWHHPPYTKGSHNSDTESDLVAVRQRFIKMIDRYKVDLIICGHSHCYERSKLMKGHYGNESSFNAGTHHISSSSGKYDGTSNSCPYIKDSENPVNEGIVYMVTGSAGKYGGTTSGYPHNAMYYSNASNGGSTYLKFNGNRLDVKFISDAGVVQDQYTIMKDVNNAIHDTITTGQNINLSATWVGNYNWTNPVSTNQTVNVSPTINTNYLVTDAQNCIADTFHINVIASPLPVTNFTGSPTTICAGQTVSFTDLTTNNPTTWSWNFGDGNTSTVQNPTHTYTVAGTYTVSLTATNGFGSDPEVKNNYITVLPNPTPNITGTNTICNGQSTTLTASGGNYYSWNTGQTTAGINVNPGSNTTYTVTVTAANGCTATSTRTVTVNSNPTASISGTATICNGQSTTLTASGGNSYSWNTGQTTAGINVNPSSNTTYTVTVTGANGCTATSTRTVTVNSNPTASISGTATICNGQSTTLTASGGNSYSWNTGQTTAGITVNPGTNTTYTVTVTNANGCTATTTRTVTVNSNPTASISGTTTICNGQSTTLTASGGNSYSWNTGQTTAGINVNPGTNTSYTVTVTDINNCTSSTSQLVTVNSLPNVSLNMSIDTACSNGSGSITLDGNLPLGGVFSGTSVSGNSFNPTTSGNGTFTITYSYTDGNNCSANATDQIVVETCLFPAPIINNCPTNIVTSTLPTTCNAIVTWTPPTVSDDDLNQFTSSHNSGDVFPLGTTTVTYTATDFSNNTTNCSFTVTVNDNTAPVISGCNGNINLCDGNTVNFNNPTATDNCTVSPTITQISGPTSGSVLSTGNSVVKFVAADGYGNSDTCEFTITVHANPNVNLSIPEDTLCLTDPNLNLTGNSPSGGNFSGNGITGNQFNPSTAGVGNHTITYNYTDGNGCSAEANDQITVISCTTTGIDNEENNQIIVYPNPTNDVLNIQLNDEIATSLKLFDVNGKIISAEFTVVNNLYTIQVGHLASGSYIIHLTTSAKDRRIEFIKK